MAGTFVDWAQSAPDTVIMKLTHDEKNSKGTKLGSLGEVIII
jgi:hypothetical protein